MRLVALVAFAFAANPAFADRTWPASDQGVIGVAAQQLDPQFWIERLAQPDRILLDPASIVEQNARLLHIDPSLHDLHALPADLSRRQIAGWIEALSERPTRKLYDANGKPVDEATLDALIAALALDAIPAQRPARYGLIVQRASLRTFPTRLRVFSTQGDTDIDRFQETALFPGVPVVITHESADRQWWFVVSQRYAAWVEKSQVAEGTAKQVFDYADKTPYRIVTGANVGTVFTPEQPPLSALRLDMGTRVPVLGSWPATDPVNGQHSYTSHVIELPLRGSDDALRLAPALLQKNADTRGDYLPLTRANVLRQAFKFLGERYGWGHSYDARDCSGFVSDVYASMGVLMPRNTRDQSVSPGLAHRTFGAADDRAARLTALRGLEVGDLVYIPGHVMMAIGAIDGEPYVIHDTTGLSYRDAGGKRIHVDLNEVSVSPLTPLLINDHELYADRMTSIVRIASVPDRQAPNPQ